MNRFSAFLKSFNLLVVILVLAGCGGSYDPAAITPDPLSASDVNLIFIASEDIRYSTAGDIDFTTANLTPQGFQRSLLLAPYLQQQVLGGANVTAIYALEPMTHLQTEKQYPDLVALETIQQFAMLNQVTIPFVGAPSVTGNSFPIFASYAPGQQPGDVAKPVFPCPGCQGLVFDDTSGDNLALAKGIVTANTPGFYVFSAPWETIQALMSGLNQSQGYGLAVPSVYGLPDDVYAIAINSGIAQLLTYHAGLKPPAAYPTLPPLSTVSGPCTATQFHYVVTVGVNGATFPWNGNTNETVYFIRHAEAHPTPGWDDGNYIAAGQWRALYLPEALAGQIQPTQVYSIDPAIGVPSGVSEGVITSSYVRPALTIAPYAIANNFPLNLAAKVPVFAQNAPALATDASDLFFTNGTFSNQTLLVAWEHDHIPPTVQALLASYNSNLTAPKWPGNDYDTIWTVKIDGEGNLSIDNASCEGIDSNKLPSTAPSF